MTERRLLLGGQAEPGPRERPHIVWPGAMPDRDVLALLLRGAIAADERHTAHELLAEAGEAATRLGEDRNLRWTAFGPNNAKLHHVNLAVTLGDAGTAIDVARTANLGNVPVTERRASFLVDTARVFLPCSKPGKAYLALRAAEEKAPEDIAGRSAVHHLVRDLITSAPPGTRSQAEDFAQRIGIAR